ncbi:MAG: branched-chain amino acid ABC transporter permease [Desulfobacteraceae bacterium]
MSAGADMKRHLGRSLNTRAWMVVLVLVGVLHFVPWFWPGVVHTMIMIFIFAIMGQGWNVLSGYAGQFSFGHSLFFGMGAYTSSLLYVKGDLTPWLGIPAAMILSAIVGLFIGFLSFRYELKGPFFALIMLAFAEIFHIISMGWEWVGGARGVLIPLQGNSWSVMQFTSKTPFYLILLWLTIGTVYLVWKMEGTRMGLYFQAAREDQDAAEALGVNSFRYRQIAMAISAAMTAVGGTIYAQYLLYIDPDTTFGVLNSVEIMLRPIIGGPGTVLGPLLGSIVLTPLSEVTRVALQAYSGAYLMFYGAILVAVIIFLPDGLMGLVQSGLNRLRGRKS